MDYNWLKPTKRVRIITLFEGMSNFLAGIVLIFHSMFRFEIKIKKNVDFNFCEMVFGNW